MQSSFRVQVSKDYLVFASAHFITLRATSANPHTGTTMGGRCGGRFGRREKPSCLDFSVLKQITASWSTASTTRSSFPPSIRSGLSWKKASACVDTSAPLTFPQARLPTAPDSNSTDEMRPNTWDQDAGGTGSRATPT